ncbi:MAG: hypothetical protein CVU93_02565, partial [Firmicutes bacterium HGW-Firmicutes-18]
LEELRSKVIEDQISHDEVKKILFTGKKSWHETEWKERKEKFLKPYCEQCGSENELTVQHFWHPRSYGDHKYQATVKFGTIFQTEMPIEKLIPKELVIKEIKKHKTATKTVCPLCGSSYRTRKTMTPRCICTKCSHEFENPAQVNYPTFIDDLTEPVLTSKSYEIKYSSIQEKLYKEKCRKTVKKKYVFEIERESLTRCIEDSIRYLGFEDSKTWCKKCSFNYDKNNADLCPICMKKYKKTYYPSCFDCKE